MLYVILFCCEYSNPCSCIAFTVLGFFIVGVVAIFLFIAPVDATNSISIVQYSTIVFDLPDLRHATLRTSSSFDVVSSLFYLTAVVYSTQTKKPNYNNVVLLLLLLFLIYFSGVAVSIVPLVAIINKYYGNWLNENAKLVQDALADANSVAQESLACIRTVVAFASEEFEHNKYKERIDEQYRLNIRQTYISGVYFMVRFLVMLYELSI